MTRKSRFWHVVFVAFGLANISQAVYLYSLLNDPSNEGDSSLHSPAVAGVESKANGSVPKARDGDVDAQQNRQDSSNTIPTMQEYLVQRMREIDCYTILELEDPLLIRSKLSEMRQAERNETRRMFIDALKSNVSAMTSVSEEQLAEIAVANEQYFNYIDTIYESDDVQSGGRSELVPGGDEQLRTLSRERYLAVAKAVGKERAREVIRSSLLQAAGYE